jgi:hypothetical protein
MAVCTGVRPAQTPVHTMKIMCLQYKVKLTVNTVNHLYVTLYVMYHSFSTTFRLGVLCEGFILKLQIILKNYSAFNS